MSEHLERLQAELGRLHDRVSSQPAFLAHLFADIELGGLSGEVFEHAQAVVILAQTDYPRAAYTSARAALEAAQDAAYLVADPMAYDERGAHMRVFDLLDTAKLRAEFRTAQEALGLPPLQEPERTAQEIVEEEAKAWKKENPKGEQILLGAWKHVTGKKPGALRHWSGLQRIDLLRAVEASIAGIGRFADTQKALYKQLSMQSHPGFRWSSRDRTRSSEGKVVLQPRPADRIVPVVVSEAAVKLMLSMLDRRATFPPPEATT